MLQKTSMLALSTECFLLSFDFGVVIHFGIVALGFSPAPPQNADLRVGATPNSELIARSSLNYYS